MKGEREGWREGGNKYLLDNTDSEFQSHNGFTTLQLNK